MRWCKDCGNYSCWWNGPNLNQWAKCTSDNWVPVGCLFVPTILESEI